jgi:hypothetical protein
LSTCKVHDKEFPSDCYYVISSPLPRLRLAQQDLTQGLDGTQKARVAGSPLGASAAQPPARHHAVHVDMCGQRLPPGVQHGGDAHLGPQVYGSTGKRLQGLRCRLEQQIVECPLVDADEGIELVGEGKGRPL